MSTKPKLNPWGPYKTFQVKPRVTYEMYTGPIASSSITRTDSGDALIVKLGGEGAVEDLFTDAAGENNVKIE